MKSEHRDFLERWESVTGDSAQGWREIVSGDAGRQGFCIQETHQHVVRRVFQEEQTGGERRLSLFEWRKDKEYGTTSLTRSVYSQRGRDESCIEGSVKEVPQGSTRRYAVRTVDNGYLYLNAGGGGSCEAEVYQTFRSDFEQRWTSLVQGQARRL